MLRRKRCYCDFIIGILLFCIVHISECGRELVKYIFVIHFFL